VRELLAEFRRVGLEVTTGWRFVVGQLERIDARIVRNGGPPRAC
jgi:hypothetical protein